jgi:protein-S-isoprenylcysteine O-methyltransferase Ste14
MANRQRILTPRRIIQMVVILLIVPFLPVLISWQWGWWEAWVYALIYILGFAISRALAARRHPDLLAERARFTEHEDAKAWDKVLAPLVGLGGSLIPLVAGLDARFNGSPAVSLPVKIVALVLILAGYVLGSYALITNRFFSGMVRIQTDRDHHVVSSGPYRWVRHPGYAGAALTYLASPLFLGTLWAHPGYAGAALTYLASPLFLGTLWAFVPAVLLVIALVIRTKLEDETLQQELESYYDYAKRVRHRLIPGVW